MCGCVNLIVETVVKHFGPRLGLWTYVLCQGQVFQYNIKVFRNINTKCDSGTLLALFTRSSLTPSVLFRGPANSVAGYLGWQRGVQRKGR